MKKLYTLLAGAVLALSANAEVASKLYIIGNPAGGWSPLTGAEMTKESDGVFTYNLTVGDGETSYFAFTSQLGSSASDWSGMNSHRYGPKTGSDVTPEGDTNAMAYARDASWKLTAGTYLLTVDTNSMNLMVGGEVDRTINNIYLIINPSAYDGSDAGRPTFTPNDTKTTWTLNNVTFPADELFKVKSDKGDWWSANDLDLQLNQDYNLEVGGENNEMAFASQKTVDITITIPNGTDVDQATIKFTEAAGAIESILGEEVAAPVEYYNIQGMKVANPQGLVIKVQGDKVEKVIL